MYQSRYYTCEEIDQRLLQGYYDDALSRGFTGSLDDFHRIIRMAGIYGIMPFDRVHTGTIPTIESTSGIYTEGDEIVYLNGGIFVLCGNRNGELKYFNSFIDPNELYSSINYNVNISGVRTDRVFISKEGYIVNGELVDINTIIKTLNTVETGLSDLDEKLSELQEKEAEQDEKLSELQEKEAEQDEKLSELERKQSEIDSDTYGHSIDDSTETRVGKGIDYYIVQGRHYQIKNNSLDRDLTISYAREDGSAIAQIYVVPASSHYDFEAIMTCPKVRVGGTSLPIPFTIVDIDSLRIAEKAAKVDSTEKNANRLMNDVYNEPYSGSKVAAGGTFLYPFTLGGHYRITNNGSYGVKATTRNTPDGTTIETISENIQPGSYVDFSPTQDANYLRLGATYSAITFTIKNLDSANIVGRLEDVENGINSIKSDIDELRPIPNGAVTTFTKEVSSSGENFPYAFVVGKTYQITILEYGDNACPLTTRVTPNSADGEGIITDIRTIGYERKLYFTPTISANYLRIGANNRGKTTLNIIDWEYGRKASGLPITTPLGEKYITKQDFVQFATSSGDLSRFYGLWEALRIAYPDNVSVEVLGKDESNTYDIKAYTIRSYSDNTNIEFRPNNLKIVWIGNIHGTEHAAAIDDYVFFKDLLENHDTDATLSLLWDNVTFVVVPTSNPWGYENAARFNSNRVNLNRNFGADWVYIPDSDAGNYSGEYAGSEAETQIIMNLLKNNEDAFLVVNRHTSGSWTGSVRYGYFSSRFETDQKIGKSACKEIDTLIKKTFSWVEGDNSYNKTHQVFSFSPKQEHGSLDAYFNGQGFHGFILEIGNGQNAGTQYPNATKQDLQKIDVLTQGNLIRAMVVNNESILRDNRFGYYYINE